MSSCDSHGSLISAIFAIFFSVLISSSALAEAPESQTEYCQQKYGNTLRQNREAPHFDPLCPTWSPLAISVAAFGSADDLRKMLSAGLSPNASQSLNSDVKISLLDAAIKGNKIENVKLLLEAGASVKKGHFVLTAFDANEMQTHAQRTEMLKLVLAAGADANFPCLGDPSNVSVLGLAAGQGDETSVNLLLAAGAISDGAVCPGIPDYNRIMLPLFFRPASRDSDTNLTDDQRAFLKTPKMKPGQYSPLPVERQPTSPLAIALRGNWSDWMRRAPSDFQIWKLPEVERQSLYRRIATALVKHGATAIGNLSDIFLLSGDEPKLVSIGIAAARNAGYEADLIEKLEEHIKKFPKNDRVTTYLTMLKACTKKVLEARGDYFRLCASEP